jgi:hypothetical protein
LRLKGDMRLPGVLRLTGALSLIGIILDVLPAPRIIEIRALTLKVEMGNVSDRLKASLTVSRTINVSWLVGLHMLIQVVGKLEKLVTPMGNTHATKPLAGVTQYANIRREHTAATTHGSSKYSGL